MASRNKIEKRDGRKVAFNANRIKKSVIKACYDAGLTKEDATKLSESVMVLVTQLIEGRDTSVNEVEGFTILTLEELGETEVASRYKLYKEQREIEREQHTSLDHSVQKLVSRDKTVINENANKDSNVFNTQRDLTAGAVSKAIGLKMLPPHVANAHLKGDIHQHDLDYHPYAPMTNCMLIDFKGMFEKGFKIGNAEVESPKSIQTAAAQTSQVLASVASSQYGGCSFDRIDEVLAPYAEKNYLKHLKDGEKYQIPFPEVYAEEKTSKDIFDAMQSLEYEINTLFTSNGQTPFVTLGFGLGTEKWEREIQKSILNVRLGGLGIEKRTAIFPKLLFTIKDGINLKPVDSNYDIKQLAIKCAQKRIYPDILNYDKLVEITGSFKVAMGCRSFLDKWLNENGEEVHSGRMNLGVITLNLPRIAIEAESSIDSFWEIYEDKMEIVHDALKYRIKRCKEAVPENAPILYQYGAFGMRLGRNDKVEKVFEKERATISIGYIGLYEVITSLFNDPEWESRPECKDLSLKILEDMQKKAKKWAKEEGIHYSVYSTPSESLTDRFCRLDMAKFGTIEHITDKGYYTNSFHLDVRKEWSPFDKIDFEAPYPHFANGGFVNYVEAVIPEHNLKSMEALWDYSYDKLGYFGVNTPIDKCYDCGFEGDFDPTDEGYKCPNCGNSNPDTCDVVKRQCGYLGQPQLRPNAKGRKKEIDSRVKHFK